MAENLLATLPPQVAAPTRVRGTLLAGLGVVVLGFGTFLLWSATVPIASGAVAHGRIIAEGQRKAVQHLEGGIVQDILVHDGAAVKAGQVLVRLDPARVAISEGLYADQVAAAQALTVRLEAEQAGLEQVVFPPELEAQAAGDSELAILLNGQRAEFEAGRRTREGQTRILRQRIEQLNDTIRGRQAQVHEQEVQINLLTEETKGLQALYEKGYAPRTRILALQRAAAEAESQRHAFAAEIARARTQIGEAELQISQIANEHQQQVANLLRDTRSRLAELEDRLAANTEARGRQDIRAPVDGTVVALAIHTPGGVIAPGQILMEIVPASGPVTVEAQVNPLDIDVVQIGDQAEIRLSGITRRESLSLDGLVTEVSADALTDQRTGQSYFVARIAVPPEQVARMAAVRMVAGMPVEVLIKAGDRTVLQFLMSPLHDAMFRAMRED